MTLLPSATENIAGTALPLSPTGDTLRDPTPARVDSLKLSNHPPKVTLLDPPRGRDSTFVSVTLRWSATDPDGDAVRFRVWLDHNETGVRNTNATTFTIPSADFCRNGNYYSGTLNTNTSPPFDSNIGTLSKFASGTVTTTSTPSWIMTLSRRSPCPAVYGCYTVSYAAPPGTLSCTSTDCTNDLLPN